MQGVHFEYTTSPDDGDNPDDADLEEDDDEEEDCDQNNHHDHDKIVQGVHYEYRNDAAPILGAASNEQVKSST